MKNLLMVLILSLGLSCTIDNYYPEEAFQFSISQRQLLNQYKTGDTISFSNQDSTYQLIIGKIYEEKHNSYSHIGINRKIQRCKFIPFFKPNNEKEYPFISCCVDPGSNKKTTFIYFLDGIGYHQTENLLLEEKAKLELNHLTFNDVIIIKTDVPDRITKNGIEIMYLSHSIGIIGFRLKNGDLWINTKI